MADVPVIPGVNRTPEKHVATPEVLVTPEHKIETAVPVEKKPAPAAVETTAPVVPVAAVTPQPTPLQVEVNHRIEAILAEGLESTYQSLDPATQHKLKTAGEETSGKISVLLQAAKLQTKKIIDLIVAWLKIIPGVNTFFLEQEAKIKADKILAMRQPPQQP